MTTTTQNLSRFLDALTDIDLRDRQHTEDWKRSDTLAEKSKPCPLCGETMGVGATHYPYASYVVPRHLGGTTDRDNAFVACQRCTLLRANRDLLDAEFVASLGADVSQALRDQRAACLLHSLNHLTALPPWTPTAKIAQALQQRFAHARVRLFAHVFEDGALLGWVKRNVKHEAHGVALGVMKMMGGVMCSTDDCEVIAVSRETFHDVVWALIELNALVLPVPTLGVSDDEHDDDWRKVWKHTFVNLYDNRRRYKKGQAPCPHKPRVMSTRKQSVKRREESARKRWANDWSRANVLRDRLDRTEHLMTARERLDARAEIAWLTMSEDMRNASHAKHKTRSSGRH